ncbi:hypothetical protein GCM10026982_08290 [Nocardiopsis aegyptia]
MGGLRRWGSGPLGGTVDARTAAPHARGGAARTRDREAPGRRAPGGRQGRDHGGGAAPDSAGRGRAQAGRGRRGRHGGSAHLPANRHHGGHTVTHQITTNHAWIIKTLQKDA